MKKLIIVALVVTSFLYLINMAGGQFDENKKDQAATVSWSEVNLRDDHSTTGGDVLDILESGEKVVLTGYVYDTLGGDGHSTDSWVEVLTQDGQRGWVVSRSVIHC